MRKLAFSTSLLGIGALQVPIGIESHLQLTPLLYLVPLIAIAFDLYIVAEDYGVKRSGEFLGSEKSESCPAEKYYENTFVKEHDNKFAPLAFFFVTMILLAVASSLLWQVGIKNLIMFTIWLVCVVVAEVALLAYSLTLRNSFTA